jgi:Uma2 family endonuclease
LREYVVVDASRASIDHFQREADGTWRLTKARGPGGEVRLVSLDVVLRLSEIYAKVEQLAPGEFETGGHS